MKRTLWVPIVVVAALCGAGAWAQEGEQPQMPSPEQMAEAMKMMEPGPHHEHMAKLVGDWKATAKFWMQPGAPPMESPGTMKISLIMGGRYMVSDYDSSFMGQPFKGMALDGYDNMRKMHVGTWVDTMSTGIMSYEGHCSDDHKVLTTYSEVDDPMSGQKVKLRNVTTEIDDDHFTYESFAENPQGEGEMKVMEIAYERM